MRTHEKEIESRRGREGGREGGKERARESRSLNSRLDLFCLLI